MSASSIPPPMFRPVAEWPLILVGPIVRRVTETSAVVWVATCRPCQVQLTLYDGTAALAQPLGWEGEGHTRKIGDRLYVVAVEAFYMGGMPPSSGTGSGTTLTHGVVYGYDLAIQEDAGGSAKTLGSLGLLGDDPANGVLALGYTGGRRPGFCLPGPLSSLRMIHASCRKAHGDGIDVLPMVDTEIERGVLDSALQGERPQQLFLTGDQIYADDVATAFLHTLREVGFQLLGWEERFPLNTGLGIMRSDQSLDLVKRDKFLAGQLKKPETHYAVNHLLFFGEWLAMYVMCWSPVLWKPAAGASVYSFELPPSLLWPPPRAGEGDTTPAVLEMAELLPKVRRALANVATYMIFDDHEVTDDWNLNGLLTRRFRAVPGGCRIFRNALLAYAVFQDYGNKPEDYAPGTLGGELLDRIGGMGAFAGRSIVEEPDGCNVILDCYQLTDPAAPLPVANPSARMRWDYEVLGPEHRVIVLDTRTWRYFPELDPLVVGASNAASNIAAAASSVSLIVGSLLQTAARNLTQGVKKLNAGLMSEAAMDRQIDQRLADASRHRDMLFVVSPAPVMTFPFVDVVQRFLVGVTGANSAKLREVGEEKFENEPWIGNQTAYRSLLARFRPHLVGGSLVFLSGDVHYGYSVDAAFEDVDDAGQRWSGRFIQLCSSAARNSSALNRLLTGVDWFTDPTGAAGGDLVEAGTGYMIFTDESTLQPSQAQAFHEEVIAQLEVEKEHARVAITTNEDYGEIAEALLGARAVDTGREVVEWAWTEVQLGWAKFVRLGFNPIEYYLGDSFYAAPGRVSQMAQIIGLAMATNNIPSLLSWSIAHDFIFDRRPGRVVKPPHVATADWNNDEKRLYERLNYSSVGDTNVGLIRFNVVTNAGRVIGHALVHEMRWFHDQTVLTTQPWCTTLHEIDLTTPGPVPWSQRLAQPVGP